MKSSVYFLWGCHFAAPVPGDAHLPICDPLEDGPSPGPKSRRRSGFEVFPQPFNDKYDGS